MTRSTMDLAWRWHNVKQRRRDCLSDWLQDALYLVLRIL